MSSTRKVVSPKKSAICILDKIWLTIKFSSLGETSSRSSFASSAFLSMVISTSTVYGRRISPHRYRFSLICGTFFFSVMFFAPRMRIAAISPRIRQSFATDNVSSTTFSVSSAICGSCEIASETSMRVAVLPQPSVLLSFHS